MFQLSIKGEVMSLVKSFGKVANYSLITKREWRDCTFFKSRLGMAFPLRQDHLMDIPSGYWMAWGSMGGGNQSNVQHEDMATIRGWLAFLSTLGTIHNSEQTWEVISVRWAVS